MDADDLGALPTPHPPDSRNQAQPRLSCKVKPLRCGSLDVLKLPPAHSVFCALTLVALAACNPDPHRHFSGPVVAPLWSVPGVNASPFLIQNGIAYFRGATQPGTTLLLALSATTGKQLWASDFTPAYPDKIEIVEGVLYARGYPPHSEQNQTSRLYALEPKTGKQLWTSKFIAEKLLFICKNQLGATERLKSGKQLLHIIDRTTGQDASPPTPTTIRRATVADNIIYATSLEGAITALDTPTHALWTAGLPDPEFQGPVVSGNTVYYYCLSADEFKGCLTPSGGIIKDWGIYAYDRGDGALRWKWRPDNIRFSGMEADQDNVYVSAYADTGIALALNAATGQPRWSNKLAWNAKDIYFRRKISGALLFDQATVVFFDQPSSEAPPLDRDNLENKSKGLVLRAYRRSTGESLWRSTMPWKYEGWHAENGLLFAAEGGPHDMRTINYKHAPDSWFTVLDIRSGKQLWRSQVSPYSSFTPPLVAEGVAIFSSLSYREKGPKETVYAYPATRTGKLRLELRQQP